MKVLGHFKCMLLAMSLALPCVASSWLTSQAYAEEIPKERIQVSPATVSIDDMKPGDTKEFKFKVQNTGSEPFRYEIFTTPYSVINENYEQDFSSDTNYTDIAKWITFSQDGGEIQPDKQDEITATIKVPQDVPAGGQYASVMIHTLGNPTSSDGGDKSAVSITNQIGLIVYSNIAGETRKAGSIVESKIPSFLFAPPITATSVVENTGNVHAKATYILQVYPFFGSEEVYTNEEQPTTITILPETRRLNTITWDGAPQLGIFKVKQTVKFLDKTEVTEKVVFLCPIWFLLIILAIIFLVIFLIVSRIFKKGE